MITDIFLGDFTISTPQADLHDTVFAVAVAPKNPTALEIFNNVSRYDQGWGVDDEKLTFHNQIFADPSHLVSIFRDQFEVFCTQQDLLSFIRSTDNDLSLHPHCIQE